MSKSFKVLAAALLTLGGVAVGAGPASAAVSNTPARSWSLNGRVYASAVVGNEIVLGGSFTQATSPTGVMRTASHLAAFDVTTGAPVTGFAATADGDVRALATDGTTVWAGGAFTHVGGVAANRLAAIDASTGAVSSGFTASANATVTALDVRAGKVFIGGDFSIVDKVARSRVAAVNGATGVLDVRFLASADARVSAVRVAPIGTTVYLGGSFTQVDGASSAGMAAVDGTTGAATGVAFSGAVSPTLALDVSPNGAIVYGGQGGAANSAVAWQASTGKKLWSVKTDGDVQAIRYGGGRVFFGFHDGYLGVTTTKLLSADPTTGVVSSTFRPVFDGYWGTFTLQVAGGYLVDGGDFTTVQGVPAGDWARFPLTS